METYGLKSAQEMREFAGASRELILKEELKKFFDFAQKQIARACDQGKSYAYLNIKDNSFEVLDVETSTTIKQVFEKQGYAVNIYRSPYIYSYPDRGGSDYVEIEINW